MNRILDCIRYSYNRLKTKNPTFPQRITRPPTVTPPPTSIAVCLSDVCNCDCIMCNVRTQRKLYTDRFLSIETYKKMIKLLPPTVEIVTPCGLGELTLHPNFPEIIEVSKAYCPRVFLTTNGTMLEKYVEEILQVEQVQVSVNASNPKQYHKIMRQPFFDIVISGVKALLEANHPNVQFNFVVQPESINDIKPFINLAYKLGISKVNLIPRVDSQNWQTYNPNLAMEVAYGKKMNVEAIIIGRGEGWCSSPYYNFLVDTNFNVPYCCMFPTKKPAGNLLKESWGSIWYGKNFQEWRRKLLSNNPPKPCVNCP